MGEIDAGEKKEDETPLFSTFALHTEDFNRTGGNFY